MSGSFVAEAEAMATVARALEALPDDVARLRVMVQACLQLEEYEHAATFARALAIAARRQP